LYLFLQACRFTYGVPIHTPFCSPPAPPPAFSPPRFIAFFFSFCPKTRFLMGVMCFGPRFFPDRLFFFSHSIFFPAFYPFPFEQISDPPFKTSRLGTTGQARRVRSAFGPFFPKRLVGPLLLPFQRAVPPHAIRGLMFVRGFFFHGTPPRCDFLSHMPFFFFCHKLQSFPFSRAYQFPPSQRLRLR